MNNYERSSFRWRSSKSSYCSTRPSVSRTCCCNDRMISSFFATVARTRALIPSSSSILRLFNSRTCKEAVIRQQTRPFATHPHPHPPTHDLKKHKHRHENTSCSCLTSCSLQAILQRRTCSCSSSLPSFKSCTLLSYSARTDSRRVSKATASFWFACSVRCNVCCSRALSSCSSRIRSLYARYTHTTSLHYLGTFLISTLALQRERVRADRDSRSV